MSRILGFDVRYAPAVFTDLRWDTATRELHLLDPKIRWPLSVDRSVWPSRFRIAWTEPPPIHRTDDIVFPRDPDTAYFEAFDLWPSLGEMLTRYHASPDGDCAVLICLADEDVYGGRLKSDEWWSAAYSGADPLETIEDGWVALGYDVANSGTTSALSNCGLGQVRAGEGVPAWAASLGPHGLLADLQGAVDGCRDMNKRAVDDGPFYVFELYAVWGANLLGGAS